MGGLKASARTVDCSEWSASATNPRVTLPSGQIRDVFPQIGWQGLNEFFPTHRELARIAHAGREREPDPGREISLDRNVWFVDASPLEGDGFEPSVPGRETVNPIVGDGTACSKTGADLLGNRKFESISLQERVRCEPHSDCVKSRIERIPVRRMTVEAAIFVDDEDRG